MDDLRSVLLAIREKRGTLTPAVVLAEATAADHPLHHRFEWDDSIAGHKYRLTQASELLRVTYRPSDTAPKDLRAFLVVKGPDATPESSYEPTEQVLADPVARELVLRQMRREWAAFKQRYEHMAEFAAEIAGTTQPTDLTG